MKSVRSVCSKRLNQANNKVLLPEARVAPVRGGVVRGCMFQNPPRDSELCEVFFQIPYVFTELGVVPFICISKRGFMI